MKLFRNKYRIKSARPEGWNYSTPWWDYVTICTRNLECFLGDVRKGEMILNDLGKIVEEEWLNTKTLRKKIDLDYFIVMPNHVHGIVIIKGCEYVDTQGIDETQAQGYK